MFQREQLNKLRKHSKRPSGRNYEGINRRAIGLMPRPTAETTSKILDCVNVNSRQTIISFEANELSGCLRMSSPRNKSRSASLFYRGRIIGCVYGSEYVPEQLFGAKAFEQLCADMTHHENSFDVYTLDHRVALAAGATFHGNVQQNVTDYPTAEQRFRHEFEMLAASNQPGTIAIVSHDNLPACLVYVFDGEIVGAFAYQQGWLPSDLQTTLALLRSDPKAQILVSKLPINDETEARTLTFSPTGLSERNPRRWQQYSLYELTSIQLINFAKPKLPRPEPSAQVSQFIPLTRNPAAHFNRRIAIRSNYKVDPLHSY